MDRRSYADHTESYCQDFQSFKSFLTGLDNFQSHSLFSLLLFVKRYLSSWLRWVASQWEVLAAVDNMGFAGSYVAWSVLFFYVGEILFPPYIPLIFYLLGWSCSQSRCFHWFMDPRVGWVRLLKHQDFFYRIDKEKRSRQTQMCYFWGCWWNGPHSQETNTIPPRFACIYWDLLVSLSIFCWVKSGGMEAAWVQMILLFFLELLEPSELHQMGRVSTSSFWVNMNPPRSPKK